MFCWSFEFGISESWRVMRCFMFASWGFQVCGKLTVMNPRKIQETWKQAINWLNNKKVIRSPPLHGRKIWTIYWVFIEIACCQMIKNEFGKLWKKITLSWKRFSSEDSLCFFSDLCTQLYIVWSNSLLSFLNDLSMLWIVLGNTVLNCPSGWYC